MVDDGKKLGKGPLFVKLITAIFLKDRVYSNEVVLGELGIGVFVVVNGMESVDGVVPTMCLMIGLRELEV